eukprot:2989951-Prymnesium_polylepis.1
MARKACRRLAYEKAARIPQSPAQYRLHHACERLLTVGDGDLSFSMSVVSQLNSGSNTIVSTRDTKASLFRTYSMAPRNVRCIETKGARVIYEVDATMMH